MELCSLSLSLSTIYVGLPTIFILLFFLFSSFFFLSFSDALIRDTPESAPSLSLFSFLFLNKVAAAAAAAGLGAHTHKKEISRHCFIVRDGRVFRVFPIEKEDKIRLLVFYFWFFCVIFVLFICFFRCEILGLLSTQFFHAPLPKIISKKTKNKNRFVIKFDRI